MQHTMKKNLLLHQIALVLFLLNFVAVNAQSKHAPASKFMTYKGLALAGYQGWFDTENDGAGRGWNHYKHDNEFRPGKCNIDFWPDMTEYKVKYKTPFTNPDGKPAYIFSSYDKSTTELHFKWMQDYGIDGVFMQRFVQTIKSPLGLKNSVFILKNALEAAEKTDRAICIMYDLSGMKAVDVDLVIEDWKSLVDDYKLTKSKNNHYLYHRNKPLVAIWGVGFGDGRVYGYPEYDKLMRFFKNDPEYGGCSVLLGVPTSWRELTNDSDSDPRLHQIIKRADIVQPWFVGRFNEKSYPKYHSLIEKDLLWCKENGLDYVPVLYPGFSWHNMKDGPLEQIPRNGGKFYWDQISKSIALGCDMLYYAMFDEMDEGTAIFKVTDTPPVGESTFVTLHGLPSDHYLWLAGQGTKMLRKEIPFSAELPVRVK